MNHFLETFPPPQSHSHICWDLFVVRVTPNAAHRMINDDFERNLMKAGEIHSVPLPGVDLQSSFATLSLLPSSSSSSLMAQVACGLGEIRHKIDSAKDEWNKN